MNIVLIGYRATGKTTLAALLVERLNGWIQPHSQCGTCDYAFPERLRPCWTWVDTDREVERAAGRTIAEIFADSTCGESVFRTMETEALREACSRDHSVIATGGGVPMLEENCQILLQAVGKSSDKRDGFDAIVRFLDAQDGATNRVEDAFDDETENAFSDPNGKTSEATGLIVWLTATAETIDRRIRGDVTSGERRPALTTVGTNDPLREIQNLLAKREPFYRQVADIELSTEDDSPEMLVEKIVRYIVSLL